MTSHRVIHLHPEAPPKPAEGEACNGCGVCCAAEPCPVGVLVSRRRHGACKALRWDVAGARYRCGMVNDPAGVMAWWPKALSPVMARLVRRWIAAGVGCDSDLVPAGHEPATHPPE